MNTNIYFQFIKPLKVQSMQTDQQYQTLHILYDLALDLNYINARNRMFKLAISTTKIKLLQNEHNYKMKLKMKFHINLHVSYVLIMYTIVDQHCRLISFTVTIKHNYCRNRWYLGYEIQKTIAAIKFPFRPTQQVSSNLNRNGRFMRHLMKISMR